MKLQLKARNLECLPDVADPTTITVIDARFNRLRSLPHSMAELRCEIRDDDGQLVVGIDEHELSLEAFGRLLVTHAGWGMRIEIVPDDRLQHRPAIEVREPDPK